MNRRSGFGGSRVLLLAARLRLRWPFSARHAAHGRAGAAASQTSTSEFQAAQYRAAAGLSSNREPQPVKIQVSHA